MPAMLRAAAPSVACNRPGCRNPLPMSPRSVYMQDDAAAGPQYFCSRQCAEWYEVCGTLSGVLTNGGDVRIPFDSIPHLRRLMPTGIE